MPRGGARPGSGRPTRNKDGKPTISSSVAFDPDDLTWLDEQTTKRGLSVSAVIALALACLRKHTEEWPK